MNKDRNEAFKDNVPVPYFSSRYEYEVVEASNGVLSQFEKRLNELGERGFKVIPETYRYNPRYSPKMSVTMERKI